MSEQIQEIYDAQRFLQLAAAAEEVAIQWRQRAAALLRLTSSAEPHAHAHSHAEHAPPAEAREEAAEAPAPAEDRLPGRKATSRIDAMIALASGKHGATGEQLRIAAGWDKPAYPSTLHALANRRGIRLEELTIGGERRWRFYA